MNPNPNPKKDGYIPLSQVADLIDLAGVYEIRCIAKERFYIGQSNTIAHRASSHFQDLKNGRHSNSAMQYDWHSVNDPNSFVFKVILKMDHHDHAGLLREELKEINRRRKYNIVLYNDLVHVAVDEDEKIEVEKIKAERKQEQKKRIEEQEEQDGYDNKPYVRPREKYIPLREGVCFDCGLIAGVNDKLFQCGDKELRCERCVDKRSILMIERMRAERASNGGRYSSDGLKTTGRKRMRWQMALNTPDNDLIVATEYYIKKYGQYPTEAIFNPGTILPETDDTIVKHHPHTPVGYIDFPIPVQE